MTPYIESVSKNTVECNADFIVACNSNIVMLSLVDVASKIKKVFSGMVLNKGEITLYDRENFTFNKQLNTQSYYADKMKFKYKLSRHNNKLTHGIIFDSNNEDYIYDWNGVGLIKTLTSFLRNKKYLPVTEEIVEKVLNLNDNTFDNVVDECEIFTNKEDMKHVNVWLFKDLELFKEMVSQIKIDNSAEDNFNWGGINDISDYLVTFSDSIKDKLDDKIEILFDKDSVNDNIYNGLEPYEGQIPLIQGGIETLKQKDNRFLYLASDMGVGKTYISSKINHIYHSEINKNNYKTLIVAPTTTLTQWKKELQKTIDKDIDIHTIKNTNEFIKLHRETNLQFDKPTYLLIGKETFKLSYKTEHGVNIVNRRIEGENVELCTCPDCGHPLINPLRKEVVYLQEKDFKTPKKSNYKCSNCETVLWQSTFVKNRKTSVIDYIKRKNIKFDSVVVDEIHESNNTNSIIGSSTREILRRGKKIILLSGTVTNGYASSIYNILFALIPNTLKKDNVFDKEMFVSTYGTLQAVTKNKDNEYHIMNRTQVKDSEYQEVEGINPLVFTKYFANNFVFTELSEIRNDLPELKENYVSIQHDENILTSEENLIDDIKRTTPFNASFYNNSVVKHYTNKPFNWGELVFEKEEDGVVFEEKIQPKNFDDFLLPKEKELINICKNEKNENRKSWIYVDYVTNGKYSNGEALIDRLKRVLENNGLSVYVLKSTVKTIDRKKTIDKIKSEYDVFLSNPKLVSVGLNLQWCPTYVFYSPSYHVNTVKQASRRGLRIDSTEENRIYHLYNNGGIEKVIMDRYKLKLAESESIQAKFDTELEVERTASSLGAKIDKELEGVF